VVKGSEIMITQSRLRWGVLSTANIGRAAVNPAIQASTNSELLAVASRDEGRAREFATKAGIPRAYGSYQALLEDADIDAVYIPLPNSMHREWTMRAAEHGKHVLCEKPLALDQAECLEMDAAAAANGVRLMEAFMYRFHPRIDDTLRLIREGEIGELRLIHSAFTFRLTRPDNIRLNRDLGGGALMDVGCYCVNVSRTIFGREPVEAQAFAEWSASGVDAELYGSLHFGDGLYAQFDCSLTCERRERVEIVGTMGSLGLDGAFLPGTGATVIEEHHGRRESARHEVDGADEYRLMVEHFTDCVLHDRPLRYSAAEAGLNMKAIEALYRSARNGGGPVAV
jgi:D-xylose 1-dehydrogenase (NADP+, D-xylono-1,5-lactone-forming)